MFNPRRGDRPHRILVVLLSVIAIVVLFAIGELAIGAPGDLGDPESAYEDGFDPAYGGGTQILPPDSKEEDPSEQVSTIDSGFGESEAMQRILSNPENLGKAFAFQGVDGEWVAKEVGELDPAVRKMMEEDYLQATGMTPYEALYGETAAESAPTQ